MRFRLPFLIPACLFIAALPALGAAPSAPLPPVKPVVAPVQTPAAPDAKKAAEPAPKPAAKKAAGPAAQNPSPKPTMSAGKGPDSEDAEFPPAPDLDEGLPLPPYPPGAITAFGHMQTWTMGEEDTLLDVARHFDLGYVETRAANPDIDAWSPLPGTQMVIPSFRLLPRAKQEGVVVNLAEMRMYYFRKPGAAPETFPIGIGRDGLMTPVGETQITRKLAGPTWFPTARMRTDHPYLPASVPQGPMNPLGTHALYLGWKEFRIHGSNKPWAIGRRVSSGCMRMYPEDIIRVYGEVPVGTKVTVVEQPILIAWAGRQLYIEANPSRTQSNALEIDGEFEPKDMTDGLRKVILSVAGRAGDLIDWDAAEQAVHERRGIPVLLADLDAGKAPPEAPKKQRPLNTSRFNY
jgi:L,D-transpeptidase ErfK/SrfK